MHNSFGLQQASHEEEIFENQILERDEEEDE